MPPLQEQLSRVPKWAWIAGGGIAIGAAFLLSKGGGGSGSVSGSQTSALTDALAQLQDALNSLGGNQSSSPPAGSGGGGSVGSGLDPTPGATDPTTPINLGPTYNGSQPISLDVDNSRVIAGASPYIMKSGYLPSGVSPNQLATPTQSAIQQLATRAGLSSAETSFLANRQQPVERYRVDPAPSSPTPVKQATPVTQNTIQQLATRAGLSPVETAFQVNRQASKPIQSQTSSTVSKPVTTSPRQTQMNKIATRTPTISPLAVTQKQPVKQTGQRARAV